jgi:hypothetical protein
MLTELKSASSLNPLHIPASLPVANCASMNSADELCDALMDHMLECPECLSGLDSTCAVYGRMQDQIKTQRGPSKGMVLAI